jgi:hypothetical protein
MKVYIASKLAHAERWRKVRDAWAPDHLITSRWIDMTHTFSMSDDADQMRACWEGNVQDVKAADVVMVYGRPGEMLRGALVEAGIGIGLGKLVLLVGECEQFGTWRHHPSVTHLPDHLWAARELIDVWSLG